VIFEIFYLQSDSLIGSLRSTVRFGY